MKSPNKARPRVSLGHGLLQEERLDEAYEHLATALHLDPKIAHAHSNIGVVLLQKGKLEAAIFHLREALRLKPDFSLAADNLQRALAIQKDLEERTLKIQAALKTDPDNPLLYFEMGNIYFARGEFNKAIARGYQNWQLIKTDKDLENIRNSAGYRELVKDR